MESCSWQPDVALGGVIYRDVSCDVRALNTAALVFVQWQNANAVPKDSACRFHGSRKKNHKV